MNTLQPYLIEGASSQSYNFPRLKLLPVREQPAFRVSKDSDGCSLAELLAVIIGGSNQIESAEQLLVQFSTIQKIAQATIAIPARATRPSSSVDTKSTPSGVIFI